MQRSAFVSFANRLAINVYDVADDGPCPNSTCPDGDVCNVRLSGDFYCQCVTDCATLETDSSNNDLFALFVIPLVVIIILLVLLIVVIYRKRHSIQKKVWLCFA